MTNQRMWDLVRYMRSELHTANLITDVEYALLAEDHAAVKRLEDYDALRKAARNVPDPEHTVLEFKKWLYGGFRNSEECMDRVHELVLIHYKAGLASQMELLRDIAERMKVSS